MKIKQVEITFNDSTKNIDIDNIVNALQWILEMNNIVATVLVHDVEIADEQA